MIKKSHLGNLLLLLAAIVWGGAFVVQGIAGEIGIGSFTFNATRFFLAGLLLLPVIIVSDRKKKREGRCRPLNRRTFFGGIICGFLLTAATFFQQYGIEQGSSPGKAGFITALYVILVAVFGIFVGKKVHPVVWGCIAVAVAGFYLMNMNGESFTLLPCDLFVLCCAFCFSFQILFIDRFVDGADAVKLACVQFFTVAFVSFPPALLFEHPTWQILLDALLPILYMAIFSSALGYTLQAVGQQYTSPVMATLLMSLESVFALIVEIVASLGKKIPTVFELSGMALIFLATVAAQILPSLISRKKGEKT